MNNVQSLIFYMLIDYSLHKLSVHEVHRGPMAKPVVDEVPFIFYEGCKPILEVEKSYIDFSAALKSFSKHFHQDLTPQEANANFCKETRFYFNYKALLRLAHGYLLEDHFEKLYTYISYFAVSTDKSVNKNIKTLVQFQKDFQLKSDVASKLRASALKRAGYFNHETEKLSQAQKIMALLMAATCLLVSDDIIDEEEREILQELIGDMDFKLPNHNSWTEFFKYSSNAYNNKINSELDKEEKKRIITLIHRVITSDGSIDKSEKRLLARYFVNFGLDKKEIGFLKDNKVLSIHDILKDMDIQNIFYTLNLCLEMTLADGDIDKGEMDVLQEIYSFIENNSFEAVNLDGTYIQFLEFAFLNANNCNKYQRVIKSYEKKFHEIANKTIATEYYLTVIFCMLTTHKKSEIDLIGALELCSIFDISSDRLTNLKTKMTKIHSGEIIVETLYYAILSLQMIVEESLSDNYHAEIKQLYRRICFELENKHFSHTMLYLMLKMLLLDDEIDTLEGTFFRDVIENFNINENLKRRYIFSTSFEHGKQISL